MALSRDHTDAHTVAEGRALYAHHCSHCHGFNMVNPGTVAYDLRQFPHDQKSRFVSLGDQRQERPHAAMG